MSAEELCSTIRDTWELSRVSIMVVGPGDPSCKERLSRCRANETINLPIQPAHLIDKALQLLNVASRGFYRAPLGAKIQGKYRNKPFFCFSENISASGLLIQTEKPLKIGDIIRCALLLPDETRIEAKAEIVRVAEKKTEYESSMYGIRFIDIAPELQSAIDDFVRKKKQ
jgi:Tfp pilus assembly protein PilZ